MKKKSKLETLDRVRELIRDADNSLEEAQGQLQEYYPKIKYGKPLDIDEWETLSQDEKNMARCVLYELERVPAYKNYQQVLERHGELYDTFNQEHVEKHRI